MWYLATTIELLGSKVAFYCQLASSLFAHAVLGSPKILCGYITIQTSGRSRILQIFCPKLHENERIWTAGVWGTSPATTLDPPMQIQCKYLQYMVGWWWKTFSDHPESEIDNHKRCFTTIQAIWMFMEKPLSTIQILKLIQKLMGITSVFFYLRHRS